MNPPRVHETNAEYRWMNDEQYTDFNVERVYDLFMQRRHQQISVSGIAGTGKTFVLNQCFRKFVEHGLFPAVSAPTNKAVRVIRNGGIVCSPSTHHRMLGMTSSFDDNGKVVFKDTQVKHKRLLVPVECTKSIDKVLKMTPKELSLALQRLEFNIVMNTLTYLKQRHLILTHNEKLRIRTQLVDNLGLIRDKKNGNRLKQDPKRYEDISEEDLTNLLSKIVVFVDEASMAGDDVYDAYLRIPFIRIIIFGDKTQLKPVGSNDYSKFYQDPDVPEIVLTRHFRCRLPSFNHMIRSMSESIANRQPFDLNRIREPRNIHLIEKHEVPILFETFPETSELEPSRIMLCHRNKTADNLINTIRRRKYGPDPLPFYDGEIVVVNTHFKVFSQQKEDMYKVVDPQKIAEKRMTLGEDLFAQWENHNNKQGFLSMNVGTYLRVCSPCIETVYCEYTDESYLVHRFEVKHDQWDDLVLRHVDGTDFARFKSAFKKKRVAIKDKIKKYEEGKTNLTEHAFSEWKQNAWQNFKNAKEGLDSPIRHTYAMTIHKSQGSSYEHVIVYNDFEYMKNTGMEDDYMRLWYVAVSRTASDCFIAGFPDN